MNIIYIVLVFCVVLFLYLHVFFHLKTSDDLEIYEIDNPSKEKLEETRHKLPFLKDGDAFSIQL